jgi:hypothetical protein
MDKGRFMELQYLTLRKEIEDTKARIFKIAVGGSAAVPVARYVVQAYDIEAAMVLLPFLVIIVTLLFLAENNALMRCGCYIRKHIESQIPVLGWEEWEETETEFDVRAADRYSVYSFYVLSAVYYVVCVWLAVSFAFTVGVPVGIGAIFVYAALGIAVATALCRRIRFGTTTKAEPC